MRFIFLYILVMLVIGSFLACSPVQFTVNKSACSVGSPCLQANGLYHVQQDQTFSATNKVDILIVDDNSGSMTTEQGNMGTYFNSSIASLNAQGFDWQIGVTNSDICPMAGGLCSNSSIPGARGRFMGPQTGSTPHYGNQYIITKNTPNADSVFFNTIQRNNEIGSGDERAIYALNLAIDGRNDINAGFFRDDSNLAVIILSDEDERSVGGTISSDPAYAALEDNDNPQTFINKVSSTWGGKKTVIVNSIIIQPGDSTHPADSNCLSAQQAQGPSYTAHYGTVYKQLSDMTGGVTGSICDNGNGSFAAMLRNVTGAIQNLPHSKNVMLNYIPAARPTVTFTPPGNAANWDWIAGTNQLVFTVRPVDGTTVHVEYDFNPADQKTLTGNLKVDKRTLKVSIPQLETPTSNSDLNLK